MEITERPPTRFDLPGREEPVYIATQRWALEPWEGEDPRRTWDADLGHAGPSSRLTGNPVVRQIQAQTACQRDLSCGLDVNPHDDPA